MRNVELADGFDFPDKERKYQIHLFLFVTDLTHQLKQGFYYEIHLGFKLYLN